MRGPYARETGIGHDVYRVRAGNWWVSEPDGMLQLTCSGRYTRMCDGSGLQRLELDLRKCEGELEHYDSGFIEGGDEFPRLVLYMTTRTNEQLCFETAIGVEAEPLPGRTKLRYAIGGALTDVCCLCGRPHDPTTTVVGRMTLVDVSPRGSGAECAVSAIRVRPASEPWLGDRVYRGVGLYSVADDGQGVAVQRLTVRLR